MKLVIASDIHGSALWCKRLLEAASQEAPDMLVLLGDLLYHGPRNPLPEGHDPACVARLLNQWAAGHPIAAVRGNCDAEVDQMVLDFPCMADYLELFDGSRRLFFTHGHLAGMTPDDLPPLPQGSAFVYGHYHVKRNEVVGGVRLVNPGSTSLPKDASRSFAVYDQGEFDLRTL